MTITVSAPELRTALKLAKPATAPKSHPILGCVRLRAVDLGLEVAATDLETASVHRLDAEGDLEVCVDPRALLDVLTAIETSTVTLAPEDDRLHITHEHGSAQLPTHPADDFPILPEPVTEVTRVPGPDLRRILERVLFAAARQRTRYAVDAVLLHRPAAALEAVATDGKRLAIAATPAPGSPFAAQIPRQSASILLAHLKRHKPEHVRICAGGTASFTWPGVTVHAAESGGEFPPYTRVIPSGKPKGTLTLPVKDTARALKGLKADTVRLSYEANALTLSSYDTATGETSNSFPCAGGQDNFEFSVNPTFLRDLLKVTKADPTLGYRGEGKPIDITLEDGYRYLVMPVTF